MLAIDILIFAVVGVAMCIGFVRGLVSQVGQIAALIAGVVLCRMFGSALASVLAGGGECTTVDYVTGYAVVFLAAYLVTWLAARLVQRTVRAIKIGIVDRVGGALFKGAQWLLLLSLGLNVLLLVTGDEQELRQPSRPWRALAIDFAPAVMGYLSDLVNNDSAKDVIQSQNDSTEDNGQT